MVHIFYTKLYGALGEDALSDCLLALPPIFKKEYRRYVRWQDRVASLFGRILLFEGLQKLDVDFYKSELQYNQFGRPYLNTASKIDFNITHSGSYVFCAIAKEMKLGIDVEQIQDVNFDDFTTVMTAEQWKIIKHDENPAKKFFAYWTIKESIIKADSRGLSAPLDKIHISGQTAFLEGQTWHLRPLSVDKDHCACLATDTIENDPVFHYRDYYK